MHTPSIVGAIDHLRHELQRINRDGMTHEDMAVWLGCTRNTIGRFLSGGLVASSSLVRWEVLVHARKEPVCR